MVQSPYLEANSCQVKKFPTFYGTRRFITAFRTAGHLSLSWARIIPSYIFKTHCNITLPSYTWSSKWSVARRFPNKSCTPPLVPYGPWYLTSTRGGFSLSLGSSRYTEGITASFAFIVSVQVCPQIMGQKETELLSAKCCNGGRRWVPARPLLVCAWWQSTVHSVARGTVGLCAHARTHTHTHKHSPPHPVICSFVHSFHAARIMKTIVSRHLTCRQVLYRVHRNDCAAFCLRVFFNLFFIPFLL